MTVEAILQEDKPQNENELYKLITARQDEIKDKLIAARQNRMIALTSNNAAECQLQDIIITDYEKEIKSLEKQLGKFLSNKKKDQADVVEGINACPAWVEELNKEFAVIINGSETYVLREYSKESTFMKPRSFATLVANRDRDQTRDKSTSMQWLDSIYRREYRGGVVFDPLRVGHYEDKYNLFTGWKVVPKKGYCSLFWELFNNVICAGDEQAKEYIRRWLAYLFQKPQDIPGTVIVLEGEQGIGKGIFQEAIAHLCGRHSLMVSQASQLGGKFNEHLKDILLLNATEIAWDTRKSAGQLKELVTGKRLSIEGKGKDVVNVDNHIHIIISSNDSFVVPRDIDDRRFFVVECPKVYKRNDPFFGRVIAQLEDNGGEGYQALLADLLAEPLPEGWHPRIKPEGQGVEMKTQAMNSVLKWAVEAMERESLVAKTALEPSIDWEDLDILVLKEQVFKDYCDFCNQRKLYNMGLVPFWRIMREFGFVAEKDIQGNRSVGRKRMATFVPVGSAKVLMAAKLRTTVDKIFETSM